MLNSQEIIERSIYYAILSVLIQKGLSLNPMDYLPLSAANAARYKSDREAIESEHKMYIELYGVSDALSKGPKNTPRIVITSHGFYPGDIGFEKTQVDPDEEENNFIVSEMPFEAIDQFIDIRLVADNIAQSRLLHNIVNTAIPQRGYIKPYNLENTPKDGNIFIMASNYFSADDNEKGLIEKVYQFTIKDTLLSDPISIDSIVPLIDIQLLLENGQDYQKITINSSIT